MAFVLRRKMEALVSTKQSHHDTKENKLNANMSDECPHKSFRVFSFPLFASLSLDPS